jgi:hypothetical protein
VLRRFHKRPKLRLIFDRPLSVRTGRIHLQLDTFVMGFCYFDNFWFSERFYHEPAIHKVVLLADVIFNYCFCL